MKLMRAATLSVADLNRSIDLYCEWLDYSVEEQGLLDDALAGSWGAPSASGRRYAVLRPASGRFFATDGTAYAEGRAAHGFSQCAGRVKASGSFVFASPFVASIWA